LGPEAFAEYRALAGYRWEGGSISRCAFTRRNIEWLAGHGFDGAAELLAQVDAAEAAARERAHTEREALAVIESASRLVAAEQLPVDVIERALARLAPIPPSAPVVTPEPSTPTPAVIPPPSAPVAVATPSGPAPAISAECAGCRFPQLASAAGRGLPTPSVGEL
jgi:hypothetical protein